MPFENFPYSDLHQLNIDWVLKAVKDLKDVTDAKLTDATEELVREIFGDAVMNMVYDPGTKTLTLTIAGTPPANTGTVEYIICDDYSLEIVDAAARAALTGVQEYLDGYYNVKAHGAKGDGVTDDRAAIQAVLQLCHDNGGGLVFFPAGTYNISGDLVIPSNTVLVGVGKASWIQMSVGSNWSGEVIMVAGNNVQIKNLGGDLLNHGGQFIDGQANMGFIGITSLTYESVIAEDTSNRDALRHDVLIEDVYTTAYYAVQAEPGTGCYMENIVYNRVIAPNACISFTGFRQDYAFKHCAVHDCECGYLRINDGNTTNIHQQIDIDNIRACYARIYCWGGSVTDLYIDVDTSNPFYINGQTWVPDQGQIACVLRGNDSAKGIKVNCNNASNISCGLDILAVSTDETRLYDCYVRNVYPTGASQRALYTTTGTIYLFGCVLEGPTSSVSNCYNIGSSITSPTGTVHTVSFS